MPADTVAVIHMQYNLTT